MLVAVTVVGVVAAPALILVAGAGFLLDPEGMARYELSVAMLRITFPYVLFISLTAFAGAVLNSYGRFGVPAVTPVILNIALIVCAVWIAPYFEERVVALAWGVLLAGVAQLAFQLPFLKRLGLLRRPRWGWRHPGVQRVVKLMLPTLFGSSVAQVNLLFDTLIASFLVAGSISWLYYSDRLMEFPLGVFAIALGTVILPSLSHRHAEASPERFQDTLDWALRWVLVVGVPAALGLLLLAGPILTTLFQYGQFSAYDVTMARRSLAAYAAGLPAFMLIKVLAPAFYSRQDTRTPVRAAVTAMVVNMALNLALVLPLAHAGLALATSLAAYLNAGLLFRHLRRGGVYTPRPGWRPLVLRVALANTLLALMLWYGSGGLQMWLAWDVLERAAHLAAWIGAAAVAYFVCLWAFGVNLRQVRVVAD